ncbi:hypothetical protein F4009_16145 [Candidatus Poribacteria bacterium]|nr:hypothetical protein [Candidatus Poribacteria bacterium]MYK95502.1 hypothetical protein [Candidatus Poribacteria bacterium]
MLKNSPFFIILLLIFLLVDVLYAAPLQTLSLEFTRELTENGKTEHIAGTLHYDVKAARVVVEVTEPVKQIMVVKDNVLEIYYPVEKQAFRLISEGRVPLPFVESIIQTTQAEYGLTAIGYTLDKHDVVEEVLYTYWKPPEKAKDTLGSVILGMHKDRLISAEVKNPEGYIIGRSRYQNHSKIGINYIPMVVTSSTYDAKSEVIQREQIAYSNPEVNTKTPNPMLNFTIPESVEVKESKW